MKKDSTTFESIMNTSAYMVLHRSLQKQPEQIFGITDQELDDIIKYDILSIMSSYYNMMNISQKKCVVDMLESETEFRNLSRVLDNLSASMKDELYVPYLLIMVYRLNVHRVTRAAYLVLFKYYADLITAHMVHGLYTYDYFALMNSAYFSVLADRLEISNIYTQIMEESFGHCSYDDFLDYLYKEYSDDINWDMEIDLNGIDAFLEENLNVKLLDNLFEKKRFDTETVTGVAEYFEVVDIVANLCGKNIVQNRTRENTALLSSVSRGTGIHIRKRMTLSGFDCCFCKSEDYSEEYVIIQRHSSYYRMLIYDNNSLEGLLKEIYSTVNELEMRIWPVHIIFVKDEAESSYPEEALRSDSRFFPRYVFSEEEVICFLLDSNQRYFKNDDGYKLYIEDARWIFDDSLYVPYLKIATVKFGTESDTKLDIKVVFYESGKNKLWAEDADYDRDPNKWKALGLIRVSSFCSSTGYKNKIVSHSLPKIYAEVFVNNEFYGEVSINCSYEQIQQESRLLKTPASESDRTYIRKNQRPFYPIVTVKYWAKSNSLFVPYIKLDVINQEREPASLIYVYVIYYDVVNRNLWSTSSSLLVSSGYTPLKQGFRKTAFLKASVGYESQINKEHLPSITAEIYINGEFYGTTKVDSDYEYNEYELPLNEEPVTVDNDYVRVNSKDFCPVIKQNRWKRNSDIYSPFLHLDIINQQEKPADQLDLDVYFYNTTGKSESWGQYTESVLPANVLLRPGFNISAFVRCPTGYEEMLQEEELPDIAAHVYINSDYYGTIEIFKSYENKSGDEILTIDDGDEDKRGGETNRWNEKSFLGVMGYSTHKPENERREILYKAAREYGKQRIIEHISFLVNMRLAQENGKEKYKRAIRAWKEDLAYIRNI